MVAVSQSSIIKTNPLSIIEGRIGISYEKVTAPKMSYQISPFIGYNIEEIEGMALGIDLGYKFYITKKDAPRGFYFMPHLGGVYTTSSSAINTGLDLGYQWRWSNNMIVDFGLGPNFYHNLSDKPNEYYSGGDLNLVFGIGYNF